MATNSKSSVIVCIPCLMVGGTELQTLRLVEALVGGGHHVVTVCYFEYEFAMVQRYEHAGSKVVCLSAYGRRPEGVMKVYQFLKRGLSRVVKEYRPKVAMVQYMAPGALPILILRRLGMKNIVATLHTDADIYRNLRLVHYLQRYMVRVFTCVTETAKRNFFGESRLFGRGFNLGKHSHCTIPNTLAAGHEFRSHGEFGSNGQFTIGMVARLESIKGADLAIPAFAKVLERHPECRLLIVGNGKLREEMEFFRI